MMLQSYKNITIRDVLFEIFQANDFDKGILSFAAKLERHADLDTARYYYRALLLRQPGNGSEAMRPVQDIPAEIAGFLLSPESMTGLGRRLIEEFPELHRDLFIHIPKTGGSAVIAAARRDPSYVVARAPSWGFNDFADPRAYVVSLAKGLFSGAESILFEKHLRVRDVLRYNMVRPSDRIFAVVRDPIAIVMSWINFTLTSLTWVEEDGESHQVARMMRERIGVDADFNPSLHLDSSVVTRIIDRLVWVNPHCECFGAHTATDALDNIRRLGITVYDPAGMESLLADRGWQMTRQNASDRFLTFEDLPKMVKNRIISMCYQDLSLLDILKSDRLMQTA